MSDPDLLIVEIHRGFDKSLRIGLSTLLTMARQQHLKNLEAYKATLRDALEIAERHSVGDPDIPF